MNKIIIYRAKHIMEIVALLVIGFGVGWYSNTIFYAIDDYINGEPVGFLCKKGITYIQADPTSTVYIKSDLNLECADESGRNY